jgi:hypothetical protein
MNPLLAHTERLQKTSIREEVFSDDDHSQKTSVEGTDLLTGTLFFVDIPSASEVVERVRYRCRKEP